VPERRPLIERVHGALLFLYPRDFRDEYGDEMRSALRGSVRIEQERPGSHSILLRMAWDMVRTAIELRLGRSRSRDVHFEMGWGERTMNAWTQSMKLALRGIRRRPGFAVIAVLTMALGIAANSTIFSLVHSVLLKPLPYEQPEQLVFVWSDFSTIGIPRGWTSGPQTTRMREEADLFDGLAVLGYVGFAIAGRDGSGSRQIYANRVSADLFDVLGVEAALGRTFLPEEEGEGAPHVTVLTHELWARQFASDPSLIGQDVFLSGTPYTVIGIMPQGFSFRMHQSLGTAAAPELWVPFRQDLATMSTDSHSFATLARMRDGVTLAQSTAQLEAIGQRYGVEVYEADDFRLYPVPLHNDLVKDVRPALLMLMGGVGLLLMIVLATMATLFLGRAAARERDVAVRTALGADRRSIVTLMLAETLVIAAMGGVLGLVFSAWTLDMFVSLIPNGIPRGEDIAVGVPVAAFTVFLTLLVGLAAGILPALRLSRPELSEVLKDGGIRGGASQRAQGMQRLLVVGQVAISVVLLTGAGLLGRSLLGLSDVDPGFDADGVVLAALTLPSNAYPEREDLQAFTDRLSERLRAIPGVEAVGFTSTVPLSARANQRPMDFAAAEVPPSPTEGQTETSDTWRASEGYVEAMGLRVLDGRAFTLQDRGQDVVMIDEVLARRYWPTTSPVGAYINRDSIGEGGQRIVGVVSHGRLYNVYEDDRGQVIFLLSERHSRSFTVTVRAAAGVETVMPSVRRILTELDSTLPAPLEVMDERVAESLARWRFSLMLMGLFAGAALFLAGLGLYGVVSYSVTRRTRELGIRIALGAADREVSQMVVGQALRMVGVGIAVGLVASLGLGRVLGALLYGVRPSDPLTMAGVVAVLLTVACGSAMLPARRATRISPTEAFRSE